MAELLKNGNFEGSSPIWQLNGSAAIVSDGHAMNNSQKCLRFINPAQGGEHYASQPIKIQPGTYGHVILWAKRTGNMDLWASIKIVKSGMTEYLKSPIMSDYVNDTYRTMLWNFDIPASASPDAEVRIYAKGMSGAAGTTWVDYVSCNGSEYVPLPDPGPHPSGIDHLENPSFESGTSPWTFRQPSQVITDSVNAKKGSKVLKFPYKEIAGMQGAYQTVRLVPGKTYIFSFYAKRSGRMDIWAAYSYYDASGAYQVVHGPSLLNAIPDTNTYRRQEYRFTVPESAKGPYSIFINGGNTPGDSGVVGYVDDAILVNTDGSAPPYKEKNGWVVNVNSDGLKIRHTANGSEKFKLSYGEKVRIVNETQVGAVTWYNIIDRRDRDGWADGSYISFTDPFLAPGLTYVRVIRDNAEVLTSSGAIIDGNHILPLHRILIAEPYNSDLYKIRYRGLVQYIRRSDCEVMQTYLSNWHVPRIAVIAGPEEGRSNSVYFDGYAGVTYQWCHRFVDWLYLSAYVNRDLIPNTAGTAEGIRFFIEEYGSSGGIGKTFWFVSQSLKNNFLNEYTTINVPHGLTDEERNFIPQEGDYIYFKFNNGVNEVVSHVGYVTGVTSTHVNTIQGNVNNMVVRRGYSLGDVTILGYGRPKVGYQDLG